MSRVFGSEGSEGAEVGDDLGPIELRPQHFAGLAASSVAMVYQIGEDLGWDPRELPPDRVSEAVRLLYQHRVVVAFSGRFRPAEAIGLGKEVRRILGR